MENTEDRENVENVEKAEPEDQPTDQALTREGMAVMYGDFLEKCYDIAIMVMETHEMLEGEGIDRELQTQIALTIFNRCTRETSGLETMVQMAMQYLSMMLREKVAETERSAELRASAPFMPTFGAGFVHVGECEHPGLKALYDATRDAAIDPEATWDDRIIEAMTLKPGGDTGVEALLCPHCRALVPLEKVTSGELWSEGAETEESAEEEKAAREAKENEMLGPRGRAIKAGLDKFFEEDPEPGTEGEINAPKEEKP